MAEKCNRKYIISLFIALLVAPSSTFPNITISLNTTNGLATPTIKILKAITSSSRVYDCTLTAQRIAISLGIMLLFETLFCCFALYLWIKGRRKSKSKKYHQEITNNPKRKTATDSGSSPSHRALTSKNGNAGPRELRMLSKCKGSSQLPQEQSGHTLDVEPGTDTYSMAYDEHVTAAASNLVSTNKKTGEKPINDAFYHVLEEPTSPLPQEVQNSLYYCVEDCLDYYNVLEDPDSPPPQGAQDSLYYCSEDCVRNPAQGTPKSQINPPLSTLKSKTPKEKKPAIKTGKPQPNNHDLHNQSKSSSKFKTANQIAGKPVERKPGLKDNVILEMKTRAVRKNT